MRPTETEHDATSEDPPVLAVLNIEGPFGAEITAHVVFSVGLGTIIARDIEDGSTLAWVSEDTTEDDAADELASIFEGNGCRVTIESARESLPHADYPHQSGYLYDCPACEAQCFCSPNATQCVHCALVESGEESCEDHDRCGR